LERKGVKNMLDKNEIVKITNRYDGRVGYSIPEMGNLRRSFASGETKEVTMDELRKLSYLPGGQALLDRYFVVSNEQAVTELVGDVEPEYYYTDEDVKNLLLTGSLDELKDCLDFAPKGVIELVKKYAVELKINDISKRQAIKAATGFNVDMAVYINEETSEEKVEEKKERRVSTKKTETVSTGRRTTAPTSRYKVVTSNQE
jgi:hypothetical protein